MSNHGCGIAYYLYTLHCSCSRFCPIDRPLTSHCLFDSRSASQFPPNRHASFVSHPCTIFPSASPPNFDSSWQPTTAVCQFFFCFIATAIDLPQMDYANSPYLLSFPSPKSFFPTPKNKQKKSYIVLLRLLLFLYHQFHLRLLHYTQQVVDTFLFITSF